MPQDFDFLDFSRHDALEKNGNIYTPEELQAFPLFKPLLDVPQEFYHLHNLNQILSLSKIENKDLNGGVLSVNYLDFQIKINDKNLSLQSYTMLESMDLSGSLVDGPDNVGSVNMAEMINMMPAIEGELSNSYRSSFKTQTQYVVKSKKMNNLRRQELEAYAKLASLKHELHDEMLYNDTHEKKYEEVVNFYQTQLTSLRQENVDKGVLPLWLAALLFESAMRGAQQVARYASSSREDKNNTWGVELTQKDFSFEELVLIDAAQGLYHTSLTRSFSQIKKIDNLLDTHTSDMLKNIRHLSGYRSARANLDSIERLIGYAYVSSQPHFTLKGAFGVLAREDGVLKQIKSTHFWSKIDMLSTAKFVQAVSTSEDPTGAKYANLLSELKAQGDKDNLEAAIKPQKTSTKKEKVKI